MQIHFLFASLLTACGTKTEDTGDSTDTGTIITTEASYTYECYDDDDWCASEETTVTLNTETFSSYLDVAGQLTEESCSTLCFEESGSYYDYLCACDYSGANSDGAHPVTCEYTMCAVEGRGHGNISKLSEAAGTSEINRYFVRAYHAEASSVAAFVQLRAELKQHDAPEEILGRCMKAAIDEVHHARMMAKLIRDSGECIPELDFGSVAKRSIFEIALDNAVEGCIFETYSALKAHYQYKHATDPRIVAVMKVIAPDETRHAQLAWDIHHFLMSKLSQDEQKKILDAQREATQQLIEQAREESERVDEHMIAPPIHLAELFSEKIVA
ncbi:MAG: hypothetical protein CL916_12010 [Deltaproteobacteria bacterium]|nr:hypothetical protein [Deltaproteobacteria bacterium]